MRTDSTRVADEALNDVREHILQRHGKEYSPDKPNVYKSRKGAQDAHEAIRPTSMEFTPERLKGKLNPDQVKLYSLIWRKFVTSQMVPARYDRTSIKIKADTCELRATGSILKFPGWLAEDTGKEDSNQKEDGEGVDLPELTEGQKLDVKEVESSQHFTQPPPRFNEGTLVKELEECGIGRPSTYAAIMDVIQSKGYVDKIESRLKPTDLGRLVTELLIGSFPNVMDVAFTADLEKKLDEVEEGQTDWVEIIREFYGPFSKAMEKAQVEMRDVKREEIPTEFKCDLCESPMVVRWGRNGFFLACSGYPKCKNTREIKRGKGGKIEIAPLEDTGEVCEKCGKPMMIRRGRYGRFLACTGYPECKTTKSVSTGVKCPECKEGMLVERRSKRGRLFFSCERYPDCTYSTWYKPVDDKCPVCGFEILIAKETKRDGRVVACPIKGCEYKRLAESESA